MLRFNVFFLRITCWSSSFMRELCWANTQLILSILGCGRGIVPWKVLKRELWKNIAGKPAGVKCALCCANFDIAISAETLNELVSSQPFFPFLQTQTISHFSFSLWWKCENCIDQIDRVTFVRYLPQFWIKKVQSPKEISLPKICAVKIIHGNFFSKLNIFISRSGSCSLELSALSEEIMFQLWKFTL